jgi:hypothetical protein
VPTGTDITVREHDDPTRLSASGSLTDHGSERFRAHLDDTVRRHGRVVIDLAGAHALDAAALDALHAHRDALAAVLLPIDGPIDADAFGDPLRAVVAYTTAAQQTP